MLRAKVPVIIVCSIAFLGIGIAAGMFVMAAMGYRMDPTAAAQVALGGPPAPKGSFSGGGGGGGGMKGGGGGGGMMGMTGGGTGGMMGGPNSKSQLAALVAKLDMLTAKPLFVALGDEQKKKVREQLEGLAEMDAVSEEEAKKRLDALLDVLKDQQATMEAAGYRWPDQAAKQVGKEGGKKQGAKAGGPKKQSDPPNPFKEEQNGKRLRDLEARLAAAAANSP